MKYETYDKRALKHAIRSCLEKGRRKCVVMLNSMKNICTLMQS